MLEREYDFVIIMYNIITILLVYNHRVIIYLMVKGGLRML